MTAAPPRYSVIIKSNYASDGKLTNVTSYTAIDPENGDYCKWADVEQDRADLLAQLEAYKASTLANGESAEKWERRCKNLEGDLIAAERQLQQVTAERDGEHLHAQDVEAQLDGLKHAIADMNATLTQVTQERENDWRIWERRIDDAQAERDKYRRNAPLAERKRAEAAEAKLLSLQQAHQRLIEQWRRSCEVTRAELLTIRKDHQEGPRYGIAAVEQCADDLAALADPQRPSAPQE